MSLIYKSFYVCVKKNNTFKGVGVR
jgi:hypothetical protein